MLLRAAQPEEAAALSAIARAAKAHWGYPESWLQAWTPQLTITPELVRANSTVVAELDGQVAGFAMLRLEPNGAILEHLWVRPALMRRGVGRALVARAEILARAAGAARLRIVGDPHAEGFYQRMGAAVCGREPAPMDGQPRFLPLLEKRL